MHYEIGKLEHLGTHVSERRKESIKLAESLSAEDNNNNTDFKCLFLGKFKDTGKKFTMKIN